MKKLLALALALVLLAALPINALADGSLGSDQKDKIDRYVEQAMKAGRIPGVALAIVKGNETVYMKGYGMARGSSPVTPQTPFTICSVGKTFTALAIRQLAGQGKVEYEATVQKYIPWFTLADPEAAKQITVKDLIDHKSGLSTGAGTAGYLYSPTLSIEEAVHRLKDVKPVRPAGTSEEYSNLNFIILGLIVEKVSGIPYGEYVQDNIFAPLGMAHSYTDEAAARVDGTAQGHALAFGMAVPTDIPFPTAELPAGYQLASAEDMAKFAKLYLNNGYISGKSIIGNNTLADIEPPYGTYTPDEMRYGIYWMPENGLVKGYMGYFGHEGGSSNFSTMLLISPSTKTAIVVLTNCRNGSVNPTISAATIARDISAEMNNGMGFPEPSASFGEDTTITIIAAAAVLLLALRAFWATRFRRNLSRGKGRRVFSLVTYALLDGALPLATLFVIPAAFGVAWPTVIGTNVVPAFTILFGSAVLLAVFAVKTAVLLQRRSKSF